MTKSPSDLQPVSKGEGTLSVYESFYRYVNDEDWPFPEGVGDDIDPNWRGYEIPEDDYYYISFPISNSIEETPGNMKKLGQLSVPFEYSKSLAGCLCYRVHRQYENHPDIYRGAGPKETCPVVMPAIQSGRDIEWRMRQQNYFYYLYKNWKPIPRSRERRKPAPKKRVRRKP